MITIDEKELAKAQKLLANIPKAVPKAAARAINRAATAAKNEAWKQVKKDYTIKQTYVRKAWGKISKATASNLSATLVSRGAPMALSYFKIKPKNPPKRKPKPPVFVQVRHGGGGTIRNAFVARMKRKHVGVFHRVQGNKSYPILQNYGPSVPSMLKSASVSGFIEDRASEILNKRFEHEVNAILSGVVK